MPNGDDHRHMTLVEHAQWATDMMQSLRERLEKECEKNRILIEENDALKIAIKAIREIEH